MFPPGQATGPTGGASFGGGMGEFLSGFNEESENIRQRNQQQQMAKDQRDQKVFETLANSDDPDIRAAAVTGLLTGNHPAKGMDKWFNKVQDHPSYDTIKGLVANGHQPFMDPAKRHAAELGADIDARISSIKNNADLTPEQKTRATLGVYGAPPPRPFALQAGTITLKDGSTITGFADPNSGEFLDANYNTVGDGVRFTRSSASGAGSTSENSAVEPDQKSKTGYSKVYRDKAGKEVYRVESPPPSSQTNTFTPVPTAGGIQRFGSKTGAVSAAPGGEGVERAETPTQDLASLQNIQRAILKDAGPEPKPMFAGGSVLKDKQAAYAAAVDAAAQKYGYDNYGQLQMKIGEAGGNVSSATPPPSVPPAVGAKKPATDKDKKTMDVNAILNQLRKNRGTPAASAPPPAPAR